MKDIVFVILNFNIVEETINCVRSIVNNIDTNDYHIIIVDNGSSVEINAEIKQRLFEFEPVVEILFLEKNIGFAKGNNIGIKEARKYNPKFICCMNNDTELIQKNFFGVLCNIYKEKRSAIIGPKVYLKDGRVQTFNTKLLTVKEYQRQLKDYEAAVSDSLYNRIKNCFVDNEFLFTIYKELEKFFSKKEESKIFLREMDDVILHGCCIIFSEVFLRELNGFDDRTFLYREEELLYIMIKKKRMHSLYYPELYIKHLEDVSTNSVLKKKSEKYRQYYRCQIDSTKILIDELLK